MASDATQRGGAQHSRLEEERRGPMTVISRKLITAPLALLVALGLAAVLLSACGGSPSTSGNNAAAVKAAPLFVEVDEVSVAKATSCWVMSNYHRGEGVFFRAKVFDPLSGKAMTKEDLQSVVVGLPDGEQLTAKYSGHPSKKPTDSFWGVLWTIPKDFPTGTVTYTVTATANDGRTGQYVDFNVTTSLLTVSQ
jgi:hypothetical protein